MRTPKWWIAPDGRPWIDAYGFSIMLAIGIPMLLMVLRIPIG